MVETITYKLPEDTSQWILTEAEYASLPTLKGLSATEEKLRRYKATGLVQSLGMKLKLPQTTIATAQVFLHRYYVREPWQSNPMEEIVAAIVFLAAKVEEHPRKLREVVRLALSHQLDPSNPNCYQKWEERLCQLERHLLRILCFDLTIRHPYRLALGIIKEIPGVPDELVQESWIIINDSYRTDLCLLFPPNYIALAAVLLAASRKQIPLPEEFKVESKKTIMECPTSTLNSIRDRLLELYASPKTQPSSS